MNEEQEETGVFDELIIDKQYDGMHAESRNEGDRRRKRPG